MPFWTVEDAGPYKEKSNFLMRTCLFGGVFENLLVHIKRHSKMGKNMAGI